MDCDSSKHLLTNLSNYLSQVVAKIDVFEMTNKIGYYVLYIRCNAIILRFYSLSDILIFLALHSDKYIKFIKLQINLFSFK